jgi:hypothetical protein
VTKRHSERMIDEHRRRGGLDSFAALALIVTFLLRYGPFLKSRWLFGPFLDNVHIYGPIFSEASRLAVSGVVPYYLPDIGTGFPVFESPHFSILYPFYFLGLINYGGPLASLYTLTYLTLFHLFLFYINLYVLLRCATVPPWAAYIGASVGMLARNTELYASWITVSASYAWLPLVLAGGVLLLRFPGKASGILTFSIAAGLLTLASPSQSVIHAALSCLVLFAAGIARSCVQRRSADVSRVAWSLVVCSGIAFGLAGVAVLPTYIAMSEMIRHVGAGAAVIGHEHIPWKSFNLSQLTLSQAAGILIRPTWIHIVGSPYVGPLGIIGTLLAGIYFRRLDSFLRALAVAFGVIGLYGLLSGFGTNLGLAYLNFHLPFIDRIREAGRHLVLFVIGVSFLSGLGYSLVAENFRQYTQSAHVRLLVLPATLLLILAGIILWELLQNGQTWMPTRFWILAVAPILLAASYVCRLPGHVTVVPAAALVSVAAVVVPIRGILLSQSDFNKPMNLLSHKVLQKIATGIDVSGYRVDFQDTAFDKKFWGMNASYYSIRSFYNQLTPQPYGQFRFMLLSDIPHLGELMGARYVLCGANNSPPDPKAKQILETEGYHLYEYPNPMGQLTLVHRIASFGGEGDFINIVSNGFDYFSQAYVTPQDFNAARRFLGARQAPSDLSDQITDTVNQPNRSYTTVKSDAASLLILNEWFTLAWKARVNGKKQPILRVNQWQTGVLVPAGKNRVEFEYSPTLFRVLTALNRITALFLLAFAIFAVIRKARDMKRGAAQSTDGQAL